MIPYGRQEITQHDIDAVRDVLSSDFLTQGSQVPYFEKTVADHVNAKYAVAVNSATSALHLACLVLGLRPGDWLWTSPITFVASANCGLYCGASINFVDIDLSTYNLCPIDLERKLIEAKKINKLPKILIAVHFSGQSCNMERIKELSEEYKFYIIEDASHAIGGKYKDNYIGCCKHSDITIFSFHPVKIITTAEGGMALTNNEELAKKISLLRSHGITRDQNEMTHESDGPWYYQQIELGYNYRMTEMQAALGISQMQRLNNYVDRRHKLAERYNRLLSDLPVVIPWQHPDNYSSFHLYVIRLQLGKIKKTHRQIFELLREAEIGVNLHYIPVHTQPYYQRMGFKIGDFPLSELYYSEAISLPIFQTLENYQQDTIVNTLKDILTV